MEKELFLASKSTKAAVIQNDDLIFNGKDILIPSYYASLVLDYVSKAPVETWNEADQEDFKQFKQFHQRARAVLKHRVATSQIAEHP